MTTAKALALQMFAGVRLRRRMAEIGDVEIRLHPHQKRPDGRWDVWLLLGGRGSGKTFAGATAAIQHLRQYGGQARVGVGAPTRGDARDYCAEGASGLITRFGDEFTTYNRSLLEAKHVGGGYVKFEGSERPERWNGPEWSFLWLDEFGLWRRDSNKERDAFYQADFGLRAAPAPDVEPQMVVTTTAKRSRPMSLRQMKDWLKRHHEGDERIAVSTATTFDNPDLAKRVRDRLLDTYGGTTLGRQELYAEILEEVEGALWEAGWIDDHRVDAVPMETIGVNGTEEKVRALDTVVVAVDPAVTATEASDQTGIVAAGRGKTPCAACRKRGYDSDFYLLHAEGVTASPETWANRTIRIYELADASRIIAEVNNGGDLVRDNIRNAWKDAPFTAIRASKGKAIRAEPIAGLYEQGRVHHVGLWPELEEQQTTFPVAHEHDDILDAAVYAITHLRKRRRWRAV